MTTAGSSTYFDTRGVIPAPRGSSTYFDVRGVTLAPKGSSTYFDLRGLQLIVAGSSTYFDQRETTIDFVFGSASSDVLFDQDTDTNIKARSVAQNIAFGDGAVVDNVKVASASNDIAFDAETESSIKQIFISSDIAFGQENIAGRESQVSAANSLSFNGQNVTSNVTQESPSNDVLLDQVLVPTIEVQIALSNDVAFDQIVVPSIKIVSVESDVSFGQAIGIQQPGRAETNFTFQQVALNNVIQVHVQHSINFPDEVAPQQTKNISIVDDLSFTDQMGPTIEESVANGVGFTAETFRAGDPSNDLLLSDAVIAIASKGTEADLLFGQNVSVQFDSTRVIAQGLTLTQDVVAYIEA